MNNIIMENRDSEISAPSRDNIYSNEKNTDDLEKKRINRMIEQVYSENIKLRQLLRKNDETIKYLAGLTDSYPSDSVIIERYNLDIETFFTEKSRAGVVEKIIETIKEFEYLEDSRW